MGTDTVPVIPIVRAPRTAEILRALPQHTSHDRDALIARIKQLLKDKDAVLVAHYYTHEDLQQIAEQTGGCVSDSLEMARFGHDHAARTLVVAGVRFMGETAKILNPEKRVLMPTLESECSLDLGCPAEKFIPFCDAHPDRTVVVYSNTSAAVKARADWVVTSSIGVKVIRHLMEQGEKIIFAPDKHLGNYIKDQTGADMLIWEGSCVVHDEFKAELLVSMKKQHPDAAIIVHPESPRAVIAMADAVGSTTQLIEAARTLPNKKFIVGTDNGIFYKMRQAAPGKEFIEAPTGGVGATCVSCAHCPWMAMNDLDRLAHTLETGDNEIFVDAAIAKQALTATSRMIEFARGLKPAAKQQGD